MTAGMHHRRHPAVEADHGDLLEAVATADLEVVRVMARRHLECARAHVRIDVLVAEDRHLALDQRHDGALADQVRIALVGRVDGDRGVAEQRHRAHGRDSHVDALDERVVHEVHRVVDLEVLDLEIGDRRGADGAPVDHPVRAVEIAAPVELDEHLDDRACVFRIHREALVCPVA
jgi:hypothetical protein